MNDILNKIIEEERECAGKINAVQTDHDMSINKLIIQIENNRREERKRIIAENSERYKNEIEKAEREISQELSSMKEQLGRLMENNELCKEVRERIISLILTDL